MWFMIGRPVFGQPNSTVGLFKMRSGWQRRDPRQREIGRRFGEHHRGAEWVKGGRSGDSVRYVAVGFSAANQVELSPRA